MIVQFVNKDVPQSLYVTVKHDKRRCKKQITDRFLPNEVRTKIGNGSNIKHILLVYRLQTSYK